MDKISKKITKTKTYTIILVAAFALVGSYALISSMAATNTSTNNPVSVAGGSASLSFTPSSGSYDIGENFTVAVYEDSASEAINGVSIKIAYSSTLLDVSSIKTSGTSFAGCPSAATSSGAINLVCYVSPPESITGKKLVANISFKAKSKGNATLSFVNESDKNSKIAQAGSGDNIWNGSPSTATFTVGSSEQTPTPEPNQPTGGGSSSPKPTGSSGSGSPTSSGGSTNTDSNSTTSGGGTAAIATPKTEPVTGSSQGAQGESIALKIVDQQGVPLAGAVVILKNVSATSDANGYVRYYGVTAGSYTVSVKTADREIQQKITVKDTNSSSTPQEFSIQVKPKSMLIYYLIIGGIACIVLIGIYVAITKLQQKARFRRSHGLDTNKAVVFDSKSNPDKTKPSSIDQGPMIKPEHQQATVPKDLDNITQTKPETITPNGSATTSDKAAPVATAAFQKPGNIITPNETTKPVSEPSAKTSDKADSK